MKLFAKKNADLCILVAYSREFEFLTLMTLSENRQKDDF